MELEIITHLYHRLHTIPLRFYFSCDYHRTVTSSLPLPRARPNTERAGSRHGGHTVGEARMRSGGKARGREALPVAECAGGGRGGRAARRREGEAAATSEAHGGEALPVAERVGGGRGGCTVGRREGEVATRLSLLPSALAAGTEAAPLGRGEGGAVGRQMVGRVSSSPSAEATPLRRRKEKRAKRLS